MCIAVGQPCASLWGNHNPDAVSPPAATPRRHTAFDRHVLHLPQIRTVQCMKCGKVGHSSGDKECPQFGQSTGSASEATRLRLEDPLTLMKVRITSISNFFGGSASGSFTVTRRAQLPRSAMLRDRRGFPAQVLCTNSDLDSTSSSQAREALMTHERFEMRRPMTGRSPTRGAPS